MDMPEKIWSSMDARQYLRATQLFLLARHIHTSLQLDSRHGGKVHGWFPVLTRQWAAISHFKPTIMQTCRQIIQDVGISDQMTAECLCSIMLLEDTTPRQVFNEFLLARSTAVNQLFQSDQGSVSIKQQICDVVRTIVTTIHQIYTIFHDGRDSEVPSNLLMKILSEVTDKGEKGAVLPPFEGSASAAKYQSKTVYGFRPQLQQHGTAIQLSNLQENCLQWIDTCKNSVKTGLNKLLGFITTVKGLAAIRDDVWELLSQDEKLNTWDTVCQVVAKRTLRLWEEFFRAYFMERTKALLQAHFDGALSLCKFQVGKVLTDVGNNEDRATESERNLANYVWTEGPHDIPSNMAWVPVSNKSLSDGMGLMMKARAYTPAVQGLSKSFDSKIKVLLEDGGHYIKLPEDSTEKGPFDRYADRNDLQNFLETACQECVKKLIEHLNQQLYASQRQLDNSAADPAGSKVIIDRVLLLGRLCTALCELSINLQLCMSSGMEKHVERPVKKIRGQSKVTENPKWTEMKGQLQVFGQEAFGIWTKYMAQSLVKQFKKYLLDDSRQALLRACTKWDEVRIEEETEDGEKIKSTIRVPMQVSWYVQSMLYDLCKEINRIGGHALHRSTVMSSIESLSDSLMQAYEGLLSIVDKQGQTNIPLTQNRALQLWFDVKSLINTLPRKEETEANKVYQKRGQKITEKFESFVDPFDLDVFMPYIQDHLAKHTQRSNILYGALMSIDRHATYVSAGRSSSSVQQEQHNVLPLTGSSSRFPLLPLSIQTRTTFSQPIIQSPKPFIKSTPLVTPGLGQSSPPPLLSPPHEEQTSSFFGQMSTIWFSNVGKTK